MNSSNQKIEIEKEAGRMYRDAELLSREGWDIMLTHIPQMLGKLGQFTEPVWLRRRVPPDYRLIELESFLDYLTKQPREGLGIRNLGALRGYLFGCGDEGKKVIGMLSKEIPKFNALAKTDRASAIEKGLTHREAGAKGGRGNKASDNVTSFRGNSHDYLLGRLKRDRPDLYQRVMDNELSANAAAIEAGFRKKTFSVVEGDIDSALQSLRSHGYSWRTIEAGIKRAKQKKS